MKMSKKNDIEPTNGELNILGVNAIIYLCMMIMMIAGILRKTLQLNKDFKKAILI